MIEIKVWVYDVETNKKLLDFTPVDGSIYNLGSIMYVKNRWYEVTRIKFTIHKNLYITVRELKLW